MLPAGYKIPHMGWTDVQLNKPSRLFENMYEEPRFYFVHSYYVKAEQPQYSLLAARYGLVFDAAIQNVNIMGAQFHAEKSHKYGMKLFQNFATI